MNVSFTGLRSSDLRVVSFNYSSVTSTPRYTISIYKQKLHPKLGDEFEAEPYFTSSCEGKKAVEAIRAIIVELHDFTTLGDRSWA